MYRKGWYCNDGNVMGTGIMNQETVEDAKKMYERVPRLLKTKVKDILVRSGMGEITEE